MTSKYYATSTMRTRDGNIPGTVRFNPSRPREYQVHIDYELVGEFATPEEAVDELKRSGFKNVKINESKIMTQRQEKLIENYVRKEVRKRLNESIIPDEVYKFNESAIDSLSKSIRILLKDPENNEIRKRISAIRDQLEYVQLDIKKSYNTK